MGWGLLEVPASSVARGQRRETAHLSPRELRSSSAIAAPIHSTLCECKESFMNVREALRLAQI